MNPERPRSIDQQIFSDTKEESQHFCLWNPCKSRNQDLEENDQAINLFLVANASTGNM